MKRFILPLISLIIFPKIVNSSHLDGVKELQITTESTKESIALARFLSDQGVVKYSAYWCPNCLYQSELFGKEAYKELNVIECARDGKNSQTQLCIDKNIEGFPSWEINGKIIVGVQSLKNLSQLSGYEKN
tara:strand:+ start:130 stop:522 length:393 start_codon:yes stop_codon:yes gene_type:complete